MELPKRIVQHKAQSDSFAILLYKLRNVGIFRNITENDYGIDFEIELTKQISGSEYQVTGKYIKAQIKASSDLYIRKKDNTPTISGIDQSTLYYWTELSYRTNVLLYAVDLSNENIYVSRPIFWQAIKLIDDTKKSKTVELIPIEKDHAEIVTILTNVYAQSPTVPEIINQHKVALTSLCSFLSIFSSASIGDQLLELEDRVSFQRLLETSSVLLCFTDLKASGLTDVELRCLYNYRFWDQYSKHDREIGCVSNMTAVKPLSVIVPALLKYLFSVREHMISSKYYWMAKNPEYLRIVCNLPIKQISDAEECEDWAMEIYQNQGIQENLFEEIIRK